MVVSIYLIVACTFPQVKFEIGVACVYFIVLISCFLNCLQTWKLFLLFPRKYWLIGINIPVTEEKVAKDSCLGVEGEIISVLEIVLDNLFFICIDDWIDIVKIKCELSKTVQKRSYFWCVSASCSWKIRVVFSALTYF